MVKYFRQDLGRIWPPCKREGNNLRFGAMQNIGLCSKVDLNILK